MLRETRSLRLLLLVLACIPWLLCAQTQDNQSTPDAPDTEGSIVDGNTYNNPALDLTISLSGDWQFLDEENKERAEGRTKGRPNYQTSGCQGPFCGDPEINVALIKQTGPVPSTSTIFLTGFKLSPRYLNRYEYPLKNFAAMVLTGSSGKGGPVPMGELTAIQLDGRPAYRLLLRDSKASAPREAGYVTESNGYVILLIGAANSSSELPKLQSAIENLKFTSPSNLQP